MFRFFIFVVASWLALPVFADFNFEQSKQGLRITQLTGQTLVGVTRDSSKVFSVYLEPNKRAHFHFSSGKRKVVTWRRQSGNVICFSGLIADNSRKEICKLTDKKGRGMDWMTVELYKDNGKTYYRKSSKGEKNGSSQIVFSHKGKVNVSQSSYLRDIRKWKGYTVVGRTFKDKEIWVADFRPNGTLTFVFGSGKSREGRYTTSRSEICMTFPTNPGANGCRKPRIKDGRIRWEDAKTGGAISEVVYMTKTDAKSRTPSTVKKSAPKNPMLRLSRATRINPRYFGTMLDGSLVVEGLAGTKQIQLTNSLTAKSAALLDIAVDEAGVSPNGRNLAAATGKERAYVFKLDDLGHFQDFAMDLPRADVREVAVDNSGQYLARLTRDLVQVFDVNDPSKSWSRSFDEKLLKIEFGNRSSEMFVALDDGKLAIWNFETNSVQNLPTLDVQRIYQISAVPKSADIIVLGKASGLVEINRLRPDASNNYRSIAKSRLKFAVSAFDISPSKSEVIVAKSNGNVLVLNATTLQTKKTVITDRKTTAATGYVRAAAISDRGDVLSWASKKRMTTWARSDANLKLLKNEARASRSLDANLSNAALRFKNKQRAERKRLLALVAAQRAKSDELWLAGQCEEYVSTIEGLSNPKSFEDCQLAANVREFEASFNLALDDGKCEEAADYAGKMKRAADAARVDHCFADRKFAEDLTSFKIALQAFDCDTVRELETFVRKSGAGDQCEFEALLNSESVRKMYLGAVKLETKHEKEKALVLYEAIMDRFPEDDLALDSATRLMSINDQQLQDRKQAETEAALAAAQRSIEKANAEAERARKEAQAATIRAQKEAEKARSDARAAARRAEQAQAAANQRARQEQVAAQQRQREAQRRNNRCAHVYRGQVFKKGFMRYKVVGINPNTARVTIASVYDGFSKEEGCNFVPR